MRCELLLSLLSLLMLYAEDGAVVSVVEGAHNGKRITGMVRD